jgi:uncharacterized protein with WD repeat
MSEIDQGGQAMTQPTEQDRHEFDPTPAGDYGTLLVQFKGLLRLYNSEAATRSEMSKTITDLKKRLVDGANDSVNSQRAANARLTDEVERLQAREAELEAEKWNAQIAEAALLSVEKDIDGLAAKLAHLESLSADELLRPTVLSVGLAKLKADAVREACDKVVGNYRMCHEDKSGNVYLNITALRDYADQIEREGGV